YKSTDAGRTWTHVGLREAGQIGSVRVHPRDPNTAWVAALGQPFGPNSERGVFRTKDGGKTWQRTLYVNEHTGVVSLTVSQTNPNELYAGAWRAVRRPWTITSGGPASEGGVYKSTDGGETWTHLSTGLPGNLIGKVDVDIAQSSPNIVYALLEASDNEGGLYRSDDSGATWKVVNKSPGLISRPFYYTYVDVDPKNPDVVWVNNLSFWKSTDGGRNFRTIPTPHGDNQGMWINPDNPEILIQSNDGGANVSLDGARSWSTIYNQPTAEIYQVAVDNQFPYRVYGAQQDNTTVIVPSLPPSDEAPDDPIQFWRTGPGCETGPIVPHQTNPKIVYGACKGEFYRANLETGQTASYWVHPQNRYGHNPDDIKYRFQRVSPLEVSPHNPRAVYHCSHVVHRSLDEGVTWEQISPDLTAREADKQVISGDPITRDITGEEVYSTIYAFREATLEPGVLWAGANDGPVSVSRDNGKMWKRVTPRDLPPGGRVQNIEPSPHRKGAAYIAVYRYLLNDWRPYIYATSDYGATWTLLTDGRNGIPDNYPARVVREDPDRAGLLYAGTEFGMFVSFDNGRKWQSFQQNLPVTPVTDIRVHQKDLVLSTMGRGFWIMDNVTPLHALNDSVTQAQAHLRTPRAAWRTRRPLLGGRPDLPEYPAPAADIDYALSAEPRGELKLEIIEPRGTVIRTYTSAEPVQGGAETQGMRARRFGLPMARLATKTGAHRFRWDLRYESATGPLAAPGRYQARLSADGWTLTAPLELKLDPRLAADGVTQADLEEQLALNLRLRDIHASANTAVTRIDAALKAAGEDKERGQRLRDLRARLVTAGGAYPQPMLIDQLQSISRMINGADRRVGRGAIEYLKELDKQLAAIYTALDK
ncbi:MAG: WD40/YVTN/BNR-like repeat-containing protein, partial [Blastocatellia bacterium]